LAELLHLKILVPPLHSLPPPHNNLFYVAAAYWRREDVRLVHIF
jgi:hypothetical protein